MLKTLKNLFDLAGGHKVAGEDDGPATRARIILLASLASVFFAAVYGVAVGSTDVSLALANVYKMPMVVVMSAISALPAGLLAWKLIGARHKASDLVMGVASAVFSGTLVLAVLAPLVALYYHTSGFLGGTLAMATGGLALVTGLVIMLRAVWKRVPKGTGRFSVAAPVAVIMGIQLATLLQFIYVASPILPEVTVFDGGADAMVAN